MLVPETLLKKRKSQEQARAVAREDAQKKKEVRSYLLFFFTFSFSFFCFIPQSTVMIATILRLDLPIDAVALLTIFRG